MLVASALVVGTAGGVLAATGKPGPTSVQACAPGQEWVTVRPVFDPTDYRSRPDAPALAGCLDTSRPTPTPSDTAPTNPRG